VRAYHHTYGLPAVITTARTTMAVSISRKTHPVVIQSALQRRPIPVYGDGLNVRDWLFVRDHAEALWRVLTRGRDGETYNVGGHKRMAQPAHCGTDLRPVDELAPHLGGATRKLITFVPDRLGHDRRYAIDASKIQRELDGLPRTPSSAACAKRSSGISTTNCGANRPRRKETSA